MWQRVSGSAEADTRPNGHRRGRRGVIHALRVLALDFAFCVGVAVVLTLLFLANSRPTLAQWLEVFLFNLIVATGIGLTLSNLYRFVLPLILERFPGRPARYLSHVLLVTLGVGFGVEVALRVLNLMGGPPVAAMRPNVFRIGLIVTAVIAANAVAFEKLREHARDVELEAQRAQQEALRARLQALQARTNPHFLFNSLNTVAGLIEEDPRRAEEVLERLSGLFRYALEGSKTDWVRLERELEVVGSYLEVERVRLGDRLRVELEIEPGVEEELVPPLVLQPLVENAVLHGVAPRAEGGSLEVAVHRNGRALLLSVADDGPGFGGSTHRGSGTALEDLSRRLSMLYGGDARLETESRESGGGRVTLRLPLGESDSAPEGLA